MRKRTITTLNTLNGQTATTRNTGRSAITSLKKDIQYGRLFVVACFCLFMSTFVYRIYVSSNFAMKNSELSSVQSEITEMRKELAGLEYENATLSSMASIEARATGMGFVVMNKNLIALDLTKTTQLASLTQR